jgi:hypothetical protein
MSARSWLARAVAAGAIGILACSLQPVSAQDSPASPTEALSGDDSAEGEPDSNEADAPPAAAVVARPFTARIAVDSSTPVNYGDDVVVSIWITPAEGIDMQDVRLHPKGALASIYRAAERAPEDPLTPAKAGDTMIAGVPCRNDLLNRPAGVPFVVSCRLTRNVSDWRGWFDADTLIGSGKQQIEAEIVLQKGVDGKVIYYESADIDFVSPKSAVILGGFFGALLWVLFLTISQPAPTAAPVPVKSWREVFARANREMPQAFVHAGRGLWRIVRSALLGSAVALVLIVMAQTTEGFDPPISVRIQDFWGGMMVGILSVPLAKWLREKLGAAV